MTDNQENKLSMYRTAERIMDDHQASWNGIAAMVATKNAFSGKIAAIQAASKKQETIITGIATDKKKLKMALADVARPVAAAVTAFASQENNNELLEQVNFSRTYLLETKDDLLGQRCRNIHDRANDHLAALADYGISAGTLGTLQTAINDYVQKVPHPRSAQSAKKAVTTQMKNLFAETDVILKLQLDKLMVQFKGTEPEFYDAYTNAREIIDLGSTTAKVRGTVRDAESDELLEGVMLTLRKAGTDEAVLQTKSGPTGAFRITNIAAGDYDLTWSLANYETETETKLHISAGKEIQRKVKLFRV